MSKKLAIKGHATQGREVIRLLKMLGGNEGLSDTGLRLGGTEVCCVYHIGTGGSIIYSHHSAVNDDFIVFTLEEFLKKFPYKVGDKVEVRETGKVFTIGNMIWEDELYIVHYCNMEDIEYYTAKELKLYKETDVKPNKCTQCVYAVNNDHCGLRGFRSNFNVNYCSAQNVDKLPNGFELQEDGYFSWVNKKPKYPKTFEECLNMLYCKSVLRTIIGYKAELLFNLEKLLICRDAYWKILGEEMGLGKPWEPKSTEMSHAIVWRDDGDFLLHRRTRAILIFPTKEMRDAFYENFKDLIESCKELL